MTYYTFYEGALLKIRKRIQHDAEMVASGSILDFEQYRAICGKIQGLRQAEEDLQTLYAHMFEVKR